MGPWEAHFGAELDWEKLWRDQVFGAKVRPWEAVAGPWEGVRGRLVWTRIRLGKAVAGPGVRG